MFTNVLGRYAASAILLVPKPFAGMALTASVDSCAEIKIECSFSGVTSSGRVWKKVLDTDDWSVGAKLWRHGAHRETEPRLTQTR